MTDPVQALTANLSLAEQLQYLTETLAAAVTQPEVLDAALRPAMDTLHALAGAVLLLDRHTHCLSVAAVQGQHLQTVWHDGPLALSTPAGDALTTQQPLYFEHAGSLRTAYPQLETQTGGITAVATAVLPLFLRGESLGVLILDFREPHEFSPEERRFLTTLAGQTSLALSRAQLITAATQQATAFQASETRFRRLIETSPIGIAMGSLDGHLSLVNDAYLDLLGYTRHDFDTGQIDWQALTPVEYHLKDRQAFEAVFTQGFSPPYEKEMLTRTGERIPLSLTLIRAGETEAVGHLQDLRAYKAQQQVLRDEGQRLAQQVSQSNAAFEAEQEALRAFVNFTEATGTIDDLDQLARLGLDTLRTLIPGANVVLTELTPDRWALRAWTDNLDPALLQMVQTRGFPLDTPVFADLLQTGEPSFTSNWDETVQHVPHTGQFQAVAHYPIRQARRIVAAIGLAVTDQLAWTERQQAIVRAIGRSFSLHYDRLALLEAARQRTESLDAFVAFTEASNRAHDVQTLAAQAQEVLQTLLQVEVGYSLLEDGLWKGLLFSNTTSEEVKQQSLAGFPADRPNFARPFQTQDAVFVDAWQADEEGAANTEMYGTVALYPHFRQGQAYGLLTIATSQNRQWSAREQRIFRSVGHSLGLALERAEQTQQLQERTAEAEARTRALEAFAELTTELDVRLEPVTLIRRAQEIALTLLPPGYAAYFEPIDGRWQVLSQVGDVGLPELQAAIDAGFPIGQTPTLDLPYESEQPQFIDVYAGDTDIAQEIAGHLKAAACLPVIVNGEVIGIFNVPLFHTKQWSTADRAILISAVRSLSLALEGARGVVQLAQRSEALERSNQELQTSNQELEAFTYSASHDLRTPVRHVKGFSELAGVALQREQWAKLPRYLQIIVEAGDRMEAMIDAMLVLSRVGRAELRPQVFALTQLVQRAQQDAELEYPHHPIVWQVNALPTVMGDQQTLQQVLTNLLSNAVKYSSTRTESKIEIWAEEHAWEVQVFVRDNGVGFDPNYQDKLFGAFQRLHTQKEFSGSGIGLATVRRIVTRHGGRVWAQAKVDEGATFGFSLPIPGLEERS